MLPQNPAEKQGGNPLWYLFSKTWHYSAGNRSKLAWCWTMFIVAVTISLVVSPLLMRQIVNVIQQQGITPTTISTLLWLLAGAFMTRIVFWAFHGPARVIENANGFKARANYRKYLLKGVMTLPMEWHVEHHSGDTIDKVEKGASGLYEFSKRSFSVIYGIGELFLSYGMMIYFSPSAAYLVLGVTLIATWIILRFDRVIVAQYRELNKAENGISESVFDAVSNISTVIILRVERLVFDAIVHKIDQPYRLFKSNSNTNEAKWFLVSVCCNAMTVLVLGVYFIENIGTTEGILLGNVYILIAYLQNISEAFFRFAEMYGDILQRRSRVANAEELTKDFRDESFTNHVLPKDWRQLNIDNLNFSHHNAEGAELHLVNVSLTLHRGERVAFVGGSGSGKTTLLTIIRDLYHPKSIVLSVDGAEIAGFDGISRAIALVPQIPEIFATTIQNNITLGAEYDPEFMQKFMDMACFTEVIKTLPNGLNSSTKEKGVNLSGGQRQRLALARGLLACQDKDIILLDEPTSSLDAANETRVYQNIFREFKGKTIISSIHHLHLLSLFDRICFMSDGQIVASGSLDELLLTCPEFQALWQQYHAAGQETAS